MALFNSCKDDNTEPEIPPVLNIDKTSFSVDENVSKLSFIVFSNKDWTIKSESNWVTLSTASGKADSNTSVEATVSANPETTIRYAIITVKAENKVVEVYIQQSGKEVKPEIPGIEIADANFKKFLLGKYDTNGDGKISSAEAEAVKSMDCSNQSIASLSGIAHFINLDTLICNNNQLTTIDLSKNLRLVRFSCDNNALTSLDVSGNIELTDLSCQSNKINAINIFGNLKLKTFNCSANKIAVIDVSKLTALEIFTCNDNELVALVVNQNTKMTTLNCFNNQIATLDLSKNVAMTTLNCSNNKLTALDVSNNVAMTTLNCSNNELTALDVSKNTALTTLNCSTNQLTALDISKNTALATLNCAGNKLTVLDVRNNLSLKQLDCRNNASLSKILLAEGQTIPDLLYDPETTVLQYPEPEKNNVNIPDAIFKAYLVANYDKDKDGEISEEEALLIKEIRCSLMGITSFTGIESFPNLELLLGIDNKLTALDVTKNLKLKELSYSGSNIGSIDVSKNVLLTRLTLIGCGLSVLDVKTNTELVELNCSDNKLTSLNLSTNSKLERLFCQRNDLKTLDLRFNRALNTLNCRENANLTTVYLEQGHQIPNLFINTPPTSIVYASYITINDKAFLNYLLDRFDTDGDGRISELEGRNIKEIDCSGLDIASLEGVNFFTSLTSLICSNNKLTALNTNSLINLVTLICDKNQIARLDISRNTKLVKLDCSQNELTSLVIGSNKELKELICNDNYIGSLSLNDLAKLETLLCQNNNLTRILFVNNNLALKTLNCKNNPFLVQITMREGQTIENLLKDDSVRIRYVGAEELGIDIPDNNFREYLLDNFDVNKDGEISVAEALLVKTIDCRDKDIYSLNGIEYFTNLITLHCAGNNLTSLAVAGLTNLELLNCSANQLTSLDVNSLVKLKQLYCRTNQLTTLYVLRNIELTYLDCAENKLTALNVRRNPKLTTVICYSNAPGFTVYKGSSQTSISISPGVNVVTTDITGVSVPDVLFEDYLITNFDKNGDGTLDVAEINAVTVMDCSKMDISSLTGIEAFQNLNILNCGYNKLTTLNLSGLTKLESVYCHDNKLATLNVTGCSALHMLYCPGNLLTSLDVKGNTALNLLDCSDNPKLTIVYMSLQHHHAGMVIKDSHTALDFR